MATKNLKHGIYVSKRDTVLQTSYVLLFTPERVIGTFNTKIEAINRLTEILSDSSYKKDSFLLVRTQLIKI